MPVAGGLVAAGVKYAYEDHDTDEVDPTPPVQNTWYPLFDADDVRLLWHTVFQSNDETAAKDIEIRWTIDGNVYFVAVNLDSGGTVYVYRGRMASGAGTSGLLTIDTATNACFTVDKRGKSFKVEVRITSVVGTNQRLLSRAVRETLEET
uniref:Uncharacterized protein n=1 Tax=viral metagenome TaxID=1070528 RepID=A0A6M3X856_9ZZZZ